MTNIHPDVYPARFHCYVYRIHTSQTFIETVHSAGTPVSRWILLTIHASIFRSAERLRQGVGEMDSLPIFIIDLAIINNMVKTPTLPFDSVTTSTFLIRTPSRHGGYTDIILYRFIDVLTQEIC